MRKVEYGQVLFYSYFFLWSLWTLGFLINKQEPVGYVGAHPMSVLVLVETSKFVISVLLFFASIEESDLQNRIQQFFRIVLSDYMEGIKFSLPALIHLYFNVLAITFYDMNQYPPTVFLMLINVRILFSGALHSFFYKYSLFGRQWLGLFTLVLSCIVWYFSSSSHWTVVELPFFIIVIVLAFVGSFGDFYWETLLKNETKTKMNIHLKNSFFFGFTSLFVFILSIKTNQRMYSETSIFFYGYSGGTIMLVIVGVLFGLLTPFYLQKFDVISKEYAFNFQLLIVGFGLSIVNGTLFGFNVILAIILSGCSVLLFNSVKDRVSTILPLIQ